MMSRKHYEALAYALAVTEASPKTRSAVANVCAADNPAFDRARFLAASVLPPIVPAASGSAP